MLRTRMAQAIITQIGPRARIVRTESLLAIRYRVTLYDRGARSYVGVRFVVGVVAIVITITVVIVTWAEAKRDRRTAEPASAAAPIGKVTATTPVVAGPIAGAI